MPSAPQPPDPFEEPQLKFGKDDLWRLATIVLLILICALLAKLSEGTQL